MPRLTIVSFHAGICPHLRKTKLSKNYLSALVISHETITFDSLFFVDFSARNIKVYGDYVIVKDLKLLEPHQHEEEYQNMEEYQRQNPYNPQFSERY